MSFCGALNSRKKLLLVIKSQRNESASLYSGVCCCWCDLFRMALISLRTSFRGLMGWISRWAKMACLSRFWATFSSRWSGHWATDWSSSPCWPGRRCEWCGTCLSAIWPRRTLSCAPSLRRSRWYVKSRGINLHFMKDSKKEHGVYIAQTLCSVTLCILSYFVFYSTHSTLHFVTQSEKERVVQIAQTLYSVLQCNLYFYWTLLGFLIILLCFLFVLCAKLFVLWKRLGNECILRNCLWH